MPTSKTKKKNAAAEDHTLEIIQLILTDHKPLKKLLAIMKDSERSLAERKVAFKEFGPLLLAHAKSEEEVLYTFMKKNKELREDAFEGDVEHALAEQTLQDVLESKDEDLVGARIKVLAELVEHHIEEEEEEMLPEFKKDADISIRIRLGEQYLVAKEKMENEKSPRKRNGDHRSEIPMQH